MSEEDIEKEAILQDFIIEAKDHLDFIEQHTIKLEKELKDKELVNSIFRAFHTIKGNAGWLGLTELERLVHEAESLVGDIRNGGLKITPSTVDVILKAGDETRDIVDNIETLTSIDEINNDNAIKSKVDQTISFLKEERKHKSGNGLKNWLEDMDNMLQNELKGSVLPMVDLWNFFQTFISSVEATGVFSKGRSYRVIKNALSLAEGLIPKEEKKDIAFACLLYDIGMLAVPGEIKKKHGKLTPEEWEMIKSHSSTAIVQAFGKIRGFKNVERIIRHHHEKFDGSGYPDGLAGKDIPLGARILSISDAFSAMLSNRPHRNRLSFLVVHSEINKCSGTQFDPDLVEKFNKLFEKEKLV